ncbi:hypothetical protein ABPG77_010356 [Micractinium sp. CCAP 211/92]
MARDEDSDFGEDEEEYEDSEGISDEEDEEEDVGRHRKKEKEKKVKEKAKEKGKKKKRAGGFIDDAAEEEDEGERGGRKRFKASAFIDDIAEVDDDEDEDDYEEEGMEDLIDDAGEDVPSAAEMIKMRREIREAELAAARDSEPNPEELEKYIKERFGGRSYAQHYGTADDDAENTAVGQQALMPTATDPKLWVVQCGEGQEREAVVCLLQKCYDYAKKGTPLLIKAVFCQDHLKGYIYVEAHKEAHVKEALRGLRMIYASKPPKLVPLREMVDAIRVMRGTEKAIEAGSWVRIKGGLYKGDLAKVMDTDPSTQRATIKVVPRIDFAAVAARKPEDARANFGKQPKVKPPARPFNPDEARAHRLDVVQQRDRATGDVYMIVNGNNRFLEGYLIRTVALKSLELLEALPPLDELQKFNAASQSDEGGAGGAAGGDLAGLVQAEAAAAGGSGAAAQKFGKGDRVMVIDGDLKNIKGLVQHIAEDGGVMVLPQDAALPGFNEVIRFEPRELVKFFESGEHVKVVHGQHEGETGMVVRVEGPVCYLFTDATQQEIRVFARDLTLAVASASAVDSLGGYEMHDLVVLDNATVGVVVNVEADALRVLTNQGRPDKPDIRVCRLPDIKRKMNNRRASVKDGSGNDVGVNDAVDVVDGPLKGRSGTVRYIMRGFLFIQTREVAENAGFICLQARHTKVRGGKSAARGGGVGMTPGRSPAYGLLASPHPTRGMQQNVLASPGRQGGFGGGGPGGPPGAGVYSGRVTTQQDKMLEGKSITIKKGPFRGMRGRVISATPTHVRLELEAQMKTVTVDRSHLAIEDGGRTDAAPRPGYGGYPSAATPMAAGGRTPMHPGITATPMHYSQHATPMHPGMTPSREALTKTPAYDPAWAATPAHPGFGGGGGGYPNAGTPAFADTPGTVNPSPAGMGYGGQYGVAPSPAGYAPSPAGYAPSPAGFAAAAGTHAVAGTPGMYPPASTPGMYAAAGTPYGGADMAAPTPGLAGYGGAGAAPRVNYAHWVDVEVALPGGERGAVRAVDGSTATVAVGHNAAAAEGGGEAGPGTRWTYPADAPTRSVPVGDMTLVQPDRKDAIRIVAGELAGQYGELVGTDGGDAIVKLDKEIKIYQLANVGRLAVQPSST